MKISNRYAEHMQNFSVILRETSTNYGKLNQLVRGPDKQKLFFPSTEIFHKLGLSVTPKAHIFEDQETYPMQGFNDMGDNTEYSIDMPHQVCTF